MVVSFNVLIDHSLGGIDFNISGTLQTEFVNMFDTVLDDADGTDVALIPSRVALLPRHSLDSETTRQHCGTHPRPAGFVLTQFGIIRHHL